MPVSAEFTDLDALIGDLDERITESDLPTAQADSVECSGVCTVVVCNTVVIC
jgi:hypothetical protein